MKKQIYGVVLFLISLCVLVAVTACDGVYDGVQIRGVVDPTAMQAFDATGGNTLHFTDLDAASTATVTTGRDVQGNVAFPLSCGKTMVWDVQGLDPVNFNYWLSKEIIVTYDPAKFQCGQTWFCDVPRLQNGDADPAAIELVTGYGANVSVQCRQVVTQ